MSEREEYEDLDVYVYGTYGSNILKCSVCVSKPGTYRLYFSEPGSSDKKKYYASFKVK